MAIQITDGIKKLRDPGLVFGILAYATAWISFLFQTRWRIGFTEFETFVLPVVPWLITVCLLLAFKKRPLRCFWWVLPSVVLANPSLLVIAFMMLAWSIGGFV